MLNQHLIHLADTYLTTAATTVIAVGSFDEPEGRRWVAVEDSIVHPQGGGQPADLVELDGGGALCDVVPRWWSDGERRLVVLALPDDAVQRDVGDSVVVTVDRGTRLLHAALHTAGHLVDAIVRARGYRHVVSNHFPGQARIEFDAERLEDPAGFASSVQDELLTTLGRELTVDAEVRGGRRVVTIGDVSADECAGTHLASTAELRDVLVRSAKQKKGRLKVGYTAAHCDTAHSGAQR